MEDGIPPPIDLVESCNFSKIECCEHKDDDPRLNGMGCMYVIHATKERRDQAKSESLTQHKKSMPVLSRDEISSYENEKDEHLIFYCKRNVQMYHERKTARRNIGAEKEAGPCAISG